MTTLPRVPFDVELVEGFTRFKETVEYELLVPETIHSYRERLTGPALSDAEIAGDYDVLVENREVPGPDGEPDITLTIVRPNRPVTAAPAIYAIHGGGMILGSRYFNAQEYASYAEEHGVVVVSVEYRLAPEHPHPAPVEDCYAGLVWLHRHATELGVDPARILVIGASAGGGLSAGVCLLARDRGEVTPVGQGLICPMLDDRNSTLSSRQFQDVGIWPGSFNETGWDALVGAGVRGTDAVSPYASPTRMADLSHLAPAYIEVGSAEVFRDESVDYAMRIWATGGRAELVVWDGGYHGFIGTSPEARVSRSAAASRTAWIHRILGL